MNSHDKAKEIANHNQIVSQASTEGIPTIPRNLIPFLESAYHRYMHFIDITSGEFSEAEIAHDRLKYKQLYVPPGESGLPVFDDDKCIEFMHLQTGIAKELCASFLYAENVDLIASGIIEGNTEELLQQHHELALKAICDAQLESFQIILGDDIYFDRNKGSFESIKVMDSDLSFGELFQTHFQQHKVEAILSLQGYGALITAPEGKTYRLFIDELDIEDAIDKAKPTSISPTNEIHLKSRLKRDGIKKKNEYKFNGVRMKGISAKSDRVSPLILMKQPFMRMDSPQKFSP